MTTKQFQQLSEISKNIQAIIADAYTEGRISFGMYLGDSKRYADYMREIIETCAMNVDEDKVISYMQSKVRQIVLHDVIPYVAYPAIVTYYMSIFDTSINF